MIPWTWAEIALFCIHHLLRVRPGQAELVLRPRLLAGLDWLEARLWLRGHALRVSVRRARHGEPPGFDVAGKLHPCITAGICLPLPSTDLDVQVVTPA